MKKLVKVLSENREYLANNIIFHAVQNNYANYTPTLVQSWYYAINELSKNLEDVLEQDDPFKAIKIGSDSLGPNEIVSFAQTLAKQHRERGISLSRFMGLLKYCRYGFTDLIMQTDVFQPSQLFYVNIINKLFDLMDISICTVWENAELGLLDLKIQHNYSNILDQMNKYQMIFMKAHIPMLIVDNNNCIANLNIAAVKLFLKKGYSEDCCKKEPLAETPFSWLETEINKLRDNQRPYAAFEKTLHLNSELCDLKIDLISINEIKNEENEVLVILNDITETKLVELSRNFYLELLNEFPLMIWRTDQDGNNKYNNTKMLEFTGRTNESENDDGWMEVIHPEDVGKVKECVFDAIEKRMQFEVEYRCRHHSGEYRWLLDVGAPFQDIEGNYAGYIGYCFDITERKRAEEQLTISERQYHRLIDGSPSPVLIHDGKNIIYANSALLSQLKAENPQALIGKPVLDIVSLEYQELVQDRIDRCLINEVKAPLIEEKLICCDGSLIDVEVQNSPCNFEGKPMVQAVLYDISNRKKQEEELLKNSKLESLGLLAGGIAHDFNNILTIIMGNVSLAKYLRLADGRLVEMLDYINKAAVEARQLTQQLLTYAKGGQPVKKVLSIDVLLKESVQFALSGSNVQCKLEIPEDVWPTEIDEGQINQVINNIVFNAVQAMPAGGTLYVSLENVPRDRVEALVHAEENKDFVKISLTDEGIGIPPELIPKIFDPYFTTKAKGNGLGLATAYSIIKKHNGNIVVKSSVGAGTTFDIYLPASFGPLRSKIFGYHQSLTGKNQLNILLMDDEETIRMVAGQMLEHLGYRVDYSTDGKEMIKIYSEKLKKGKLFDVVIMDLTIPGGMGGKEAVQKLLQIDPQAKAIVSSGYSEDPVMSDYKKYGFRACMAKPYLVTEMERAIQIAIS